MKNFKKILATMALLAAPAIALADAPTIEITEPAPGTIIYVEKFPEVVSVTFTITHDDTQGPAHNQKIGLTLINVLDVRVDDESLLSSGEIGNPFQQGSQDNVCSDNVNVQFSNCTINSDISATLEYDWIVDGAGVYPLSIVARHQGQEGDDEVTVKLVLVSVEHPAPPAVANEILKSYPKIKGGVHGCIISNIAKKHAIESAYGPKGGPYDKEKIADDVSAFLAQCQK